MTSVTNELNTASWVDKNEDLVNDSNASNTNVVTSDQDDLDESSTPSSSAPPVRKRTRATADQLSVLEDTFAVNVSPNSKLRKQLAEQLHMSERSIQIWFQNRRAKVKHMQKRAQMQMHQASIRAQLYQYQQQQQHHQQQQHYSIPPPQPPILPMQQHPFYYNTPAASAAAAAAARLAIPRAQSVDAIQHYNRIHQQPPQHLFTPPSSVPHTSYSATPPPVSLPRYFSQPAWPMNEADQVTLSRQSMPPQVYPYDFGSVEPSISGLDFPEYLHGQVSPSSSPRPDLLHQATKQAAASAAANMPTLVSVPDAGPTAVLASSYKPGASDNKYDTTKSSITEENWVASSSSPGNY
jgi:hypothetical protein